MSFTIFLERCGHYVRQDAAFAIHDQIMSSCLCGHDSGGGGGHDKGDMLPGGSASWSAGGTAAARMRVSCSGDTVSASSAKSLAALACDLWVAARSENLARVGFLPLLWVGPLCYSVVVVLILD